MMPAIFPTSGQVASLQGIPRDFRYSLRSGDTPWARKTRMLFLSEPLISPSIGFSLL